MSYEYSENVLVQQSTAKLLHETLAWDVEYAYNKETLGTNSTLGRSSYKEIILQPSLKKSLFQNNAWLTDELYNDAYKKLIAFNSSASTMQINKEKYNLLVNGIPLTVKDEQGHTQERKAKIFNFEEPEKNQFLAVLEMKIWGELYHRRTDIVGFVNGIPLLCIELKRQDVDVVEAYNNNYTDYQQTIPQLFHFNAFVMLSNGQSAKIGTLGSKYDFFQDWKRLHENEKGSVDLETMLCGICKKENLMDLFQNFILYDQNGGKTIKILARNHQYLGVNTAVARYKNKDFKDGKLGVFWHTQGSGKSYSMIFFAQKIRRTLHGSPTFVILTDRDELNKQISDTFESCGCLGDTKAKQFIASSGADLAEKLKGNPSYIFTLIQKFNKQDMQPIITDHEIIVISDEAHRSQNGVFADNMTSLLPNASRLGFTGTPILKYDNITERTFGNYVSVYDFNDAVADGATVPLYYENRGEKLKLENPQINDDFLQAIEDADLDTNQKSKLELEMKKEIHILTSEKRLEQVAADFVDHYCETWTSGKAMFVCVNKQTTVKMFDKVSKYWKLKIAEVESSLNSTACECEGQSITSEQEEQEIRRKIEWLKSTDMAVVVSEEQNEIEKFKKYSLDIIPHRKRIINEELDKKFKDPDDPFRIVFVCAMWLTGFDVPCLGSLYLDKPLKAHSLMQAIARANRVYEGKSNGLIIDYVGVVKALQRALCDYHKKGSASTDPVTIDKEKLQMRISTLIHDINKYLIDIDFHMDDLRLADDFKKMAILLDGANKLCSSEDIKKRFEVMASELFKLWKYTERSETSDEEKSYKNAISAVYNQIQVKRKSSDISCIMIKLQNIVDSYVDIEQNNKVATTSFDISKIDFDRLNQMFKKVKHKNLLLKDLKDEINDKLDKMIKQNPMRVDFYNTYQKIINEYNNDQNKTEIEKTFMDLSALIKTLNEEENRYVREGFNNDEELAVYDLLYKKNLATTEIRKLKDLSKVLLDKVKSKIHELHNWQEKEETQAMVLEIIRIELYQNLPDNYNETELPVYQQKLYEWIYYTYPA